MSLLSGCATTPATSTAINTFCAVAKPIRLSRSDNITDGTRTQIIEHNDIGIVQCGWQK